MMSLNEIDQQYDLLQKSVRAEADVPDEAKTYICFALILLKDMHLKLTKISNEVR